MSSEQLPQSINDASRLVTPTGSLITSHHTTTRTFQWNAPWQHVVSPSSSSYIHPSMLFIPGHRRIIPDLVMTQSEQSSGSNVCPCHQGPQLAPRGYTTMGTRYSLLELSRYMSTPLAYTIQAEAQRTMLTNHPDGTYLVCLHFSEINMSSLHKVTRRIQYIGRSN
jgi:hypothetical protein